MQNSNSTNSDGREGLMTRVLAMEPLQIAQFVLGMPTISPVITKLARAYIDEHTVPIVKPPRAKLGWLRIFAIVALCGSLSLLLPKVVHDLVYFFLR